MATPSTRTIRVLRWIARILGTILAVFTLLRFGVEIITTPGWQPGEPSYWVILIPFWIAQIGLLLAWRWEKLGGILATACIIFQGAVGFIILKLPALLIMDAFFLIPALLFIYCWYWTNKPPPIEAPETVGGIA